MKKRAEQVDQTRARIVEATVELHGTLGPSATSIAAIAERAGVTRLTVYRHFEDDEALFAACSAHWLAQQVPPNPEAWSRLPDPELRLRHGLADLYRFFREGEPMLTHVHRERESLPMTLQRGLDAEERLYVEVLGEPLDGDGSPRLDAVLGHAVSFWTWRSLCRDGGLPDADAAELIASMVLANAEEAAPRAETG